MTDRRLYRNASILAVNVDFDSVGMAVHDGMVHVNASEKTDRPEPGATTHSLPADAVVAIQLRVRDADGAFADTGRAGYVMWPEHTFPAKFPDHMIDPYPKDERIVSVLEDAWVRVRTNTADGWVLTDYPPHVHGGVVWSTEHPDEDQ